VGRPAAQQPHERAGSAGATAGGMAPSACKRRGVITKRLRCPWGTICEAWERKSRGGEEGWCTDAGKGKGQSSQAFHPQLTPLCAPGGYWAVVAGGNRGPGACRRGVRIADCRC
jgi:hypothetical protein